jgi:predicted O-methyltransferase YrrM
MISPESALAQWTSVDRYISNLLIEPDSSLEEALRASAEAGLPPHQVSSTQGKLLHLLARIQGARAILEIGTLGGYSTIWLARALPPGGHLITLEANPAHASVARTNIARAGLAGVVEVRVGPAQDTLPLLTAGQRDPFDLIFIDADKAATPDYFIWALKLARVGSLIIVDNVVRDGALGDAASKDPNVIGVRRLHELLAVERRVSATTLQTVGCKGYDGFTLAFVNAKEVK